MLFRARQAVIKLIKYLSHFIVNDERHKSIYNDTLKVLSSRNINDI